MLLRRCSLALAIALGSVGCLRSTTTIDLKSDGSGTIVQETAVSAQALGMIQGLAGANQTGEKPPQLFGEEQARKAAATMGVTFVSGETIKTGDLEGYRARYAFADISKVSVKMDQTDNLAPGSETKKPPFAFMFKRGAAASVLTIQMPDQSPGASQLPMPGAGGTDAEKAQAAQAMSDDEDDDARSLRRRRADGERPHHQEQRALCRGFSRHAHAARLRQAASDDAALPKLQSAKDIKSLAAVPGLKVVTEPTVTIEFSR